MKLQKLVKNYNETVRDWDTQNAQVRAWTTVCYNKQYYRGFYILSTMRLNDDDVPGLEVHYVYGRRYEKYGLRRILGRRYYIKRRIQK